MWRTGPVPTCRGPVQGPPHEDPNTRGPRRQNGKERAERTHKAQNWQRLGQQLVNNWATIGQQLVNNWSTIGQPSGKNWATIGQQLGNNWCTSRPELVKTWSTIWQQLVKNWATLQKLQYKKEKFVPKIEKFEISQIFYFS